ncbi:MAG: GIY-YIG nuclease family protein [Elusimicrobiota bacterium]|nr:GIY-YIG nuclease family protein [Elusimicrobiota bacterium]
MGQNRFAVMEIETKNIPASAGVYIFKGINDKILYVGKAGNLRKRLASYFKKEIKSKTFYLMAAARRIEFLRTSGPKEALVLEEKLIKLLKPKYNVQLADDKNYPYVCLTDEKYPRFLYSRGRKTANCFGPYPDVSALKLSMRRLLRVFSLPVCTAQQYARIARGGDAERCVYRHIENCAAPCCGKISQKDHMKKVRGLAGFLKGRATARVKELEKKMREYSAKADYEEALRIKKIIDAFREVQERVRVVSADAAKYLLRPREALKELRDILGLKRIPETIDGIDISHTQGSNSVASAVRFFKGLPDKESYRKYAMRTKGIDDCAMIKEAVMRRFKKESADLILIDGGAGQLHSAFEGLAKIGKKIDVIGLAKREELIYRKDDAPLSLPVDSPALRLLMFVRDEAHRFALAYHRQRRRKTMRSGLAS